jgi:hypothetical protein
VNQGCGGKEIRQRGSKERKGVGRISQKGRSCWPRGPWEKQDDPLGAAGQAFRRERRASAAPRQAGCGMLMPDGRPKRKLW